MTWKDRSEKKFYVTFVSGQAQAGIYRPDKKLGIRAFDQQGRLVEFKTQPNEQGKYRRTIITYDAFGWHEMKEYIEMVRIMPARYSDVMERETLLSEWTIARSVTTDLFVSFPSAVA